MKKILFLIPNLMHGGAEKVLVNLVNNMDKTRYDITLQTLFDIGINKQYLQPHIKYKSVFKKQFRGYSHILKLFSPNFLHKWFIEDKYDIEISYLEGPTARIISATESKKVLWIHIELEGKKLFRLGFRNNAEAVLLYNRFDKIIHVSNTVKEIFNKNGNVLSPSEVLYNTNETVQIVEKGNIPIVDLSFEANTINICSVGKIISAKGYDRLARIHKKLLDEGIRNHIYIFGIGNEQQKIETYLKENNLNDTFTFVGFRDNPYKYISKCDLFICSSRREGFSTAVTEALILGVPVVSTCCSGAVELLGANNEYGIVTENNEDSLYEGIKKMLSDPNLLEYYKKQSKIRGQKFSKEKTVKAVEDMLDKLILSDEARKI